MECEQIIKALECCHTPLASDCNYCGYRGKSVENGEYISCSNRLMNDAISLIKELTEENERLREENDELCDNIACLEIDKENAERRTVRKMHSEIEARCIKGGIYPAFVKSTIDQIEKEMVGV